MHQTSRVCLRKNQYFLADTRIVIVTAAEEQQQDNNNNDDPAATKSTTTKSHNQNLPLS